MENILKGDGEIMEQVSDGLAIAPDAEIVQLNCSSLLLDLFLLGGFFVLLGILLHDEQNLQLSTVFARELEMIIFSPYFKKEFDLSKAELAGSGNFAKVYRIYDSNLKDSLAVRIVQKNACTTQDLITEKEINEELRKIQSQHILRIFDIIDNPKVIIYIMEYCSGGSLWDVLNTCKDHRMSEKQALLCIQQISKGVQQLHSCCITHRDLKPENILMKTPYHHGKSIPIIKVADFGLSTTKIIMETIAGTKEYIAPEQASFQNYTNAVDVWSLGIILDEMLHGTPFYNGSDNTEVFARILKTPFKIRDEKIRPSLKSFLISLLKKKPYQRPIIAVILKMIDSLLAEIKSEQPEVVSLNQPVKIHLDSIPIEEQKEIQNIVEAPQQKVEVEVLESSSSKPTSIPEAFSPLTRRRRDNMQVVEDSGVVLNLMQENKKANKRQGNVELVRAEQYMARVEALKQRLREASFRLIRQQKFIPSTHLNQAQFIQKSNESEDGLNEFKQKFKCLGFVAESEEYERELLNARRQLLREKQKCKIKMENQIKTIQSVLWNQLDEIVDQFVEKSVR